jgi:(S)-ureidoglycine aminohydrolase
MKNRFIALLLLIPVLGLSQSPSSETLPLIPYVKYSWKTPLEKQGKNILSTQLLKGRGYDMEYLQLDACALQSTKKKISLQVPGEEEYLFIIKSGKLILSFGDSTWTIGPGSIALLMPHEKYSLKNSSVNPCLYYLMKYRSKSSPDASRGKLSGGSFVRDWNKLVFRKHDRGGVRSYFEKPTAMCKRFEMHVTTLKEGLKSHDPHTHRAEEIILMLEDAEGGKSKTEMQIGERFFSGEAGDLFFAGSNVLHGIRNDGAVPCSYFAFQFE